MIAEGETAIPNIEVRIHGGEWPVGILNPDDYIERDGSQMKQGQRTICMPAPE